MLTSPTYALLRGGGITHSLVKINILDTGYNPLYDYDDFGGFIGKTDFSVHWAEIEFFVPKNVDATRLFLLLNKMNIIRHKLNYNHRLFEEF